MNIASRPSALWRGLIWIVYCAATIRNLHDSEWAHALLLLAALVIVPVGFELIRAAEGKGARCGWRTNAEGLLFPSALLLMLACLLPRGMWSALAAAPWTLVCLLSALSGGSRLFADNAWRSVDGICLTAALMFLGVGGAWVAVDRGGFQPLNFPEQIVTLTAVHFHFAGFVLPLVAGLTAQLFRPSRFAAAAGIAACVGVPAVAVGITTAQVGGGSTAEAFAGGLLALSGTSIAILQFRVAARSDQSRVAKVLFVFAGISLFFGMMLAGIYAFRSEVVTLPWLDVPWMRALHGTANALGFSLVAVFAWRSRTMKVTENR